MAVAAAGLRSQQELIENSTIKAFSFSCSREEAKNKHQTEENIGRARYLVDKKLRLLQKLQDIDGEILLLLRSD